LEQCSPASSMPQMKRFPAQLTEAGVFSKKYN
jgi:hypothetical protein